MTARVLDFDLGAELLRGEDFEILRRRRLWENRHAIAAQRWRLEAERRARGETIPGRPLTLEQAACPCGQSAPEGAA